MLSPSRIFVRDAYRLPAQRTAALLEVHSASLQAVTRRWQGLQVPDLDGVNL
jgi:hypothetical protein